MNQVRQVANAAEIIDWGEILAKLTAHALRQLKEGSVETAEEIAQEAIVREHDARYKSWDPQTQPSLLKHLGSVVNGLIRNQNTSGTAYAEKLRAPEALIELSDRKIDVWSKYGDDRIDAIALLRNVEARISDDGVAEQIFLAWCDGFDSPREQAKESNLPIQEVYNARRRLADHAKAARRHTSGVES